MHRHPIYMDHHATTPVDEQVFEAMRPYFCEKFGNASSRIHAHGKVARDGVEAARGQVAALIDATPEEVVFTSGATESDNLAVRGVAQARTSKGKHIVTVATEHKAVLDPCGALEREGWEITWLPVDARGLLELDTLRSALREDTVLLSVMLANNEVGVVQDLAEIGRVARERDVVFHCDAAQGLGYLPFSVATLPVDLVSMSAHKMYGPKGVGALYVSRRIRRRGMLAPQLHGGGHEGGLRSGTLNVPGIVGFGAAAETMQRVGLDEAARIATLRDDLETQLVEALDEVRVNGSGASRHPGNLNMSFGYVDGAALLLRLCEVVSVSSGAACSSAEAGPSYVLAAMGVPEDWSAASIRFGLGRATTKIEVDRVAETVIETVEELRKSSPLWSAKRKGLSIDW
jgi:cysteine desulfurase